ncbi:50S ribosomal protein L23 [Candidatus Falkowbacteria bacterium]|nr:50S ribosomal protein L23 [Candidatus Falkowbacteria bacterium]
MKDLYSDGAAKSAKTSEAKPKYDQAYRWIEKPLVTEKASVLNAMNQYVFAVAKDANKVEVAKAIEAIYGVKPIAVNMIRVSGKKVRHGRLQGKRKDWKKAVITLPAGKSIQVYEGV